MSHAAIALIAFSAFGIALGAAGGFLYGRRWFDEHRTALGQVLIRHSDSLRRIDGLAGALQRTRGAERSLRGCDDPRASAALNETLRLDTELRREVARFLELNKCAERKGAAPMTLHPPDAEALLSEA